MYKDYYAPSGILVISEVPVLNVQDNLWSALYGTYRRWYRKARGIEDLPGSR